ncbi:MAG: hypothetical protein N2491_03220 [Negativicutes bacterium]|nr:hypothetical protein [Negativicutes bacterium]
MRFPSKSWFIAAACALCLILLLPGIFVQAAPGDMNPGYGQRQINPSQFAKTMSDLFGVSEAAVSRYLAAGVSYRDIGAGSFLALASGNSLDEIMPLKTSSNTWREVAQKLGVTRQQAKATSHNVVIGQFHAKLGLEQSVTRTLLADGYKPRDIAIAGLFARDTAKSIEEVLAVKRINNTWLDVARILAIPPERVRDDMRLLQEAFPWAKPRHIW